MSTPKRRVIFFAPYKQSEAAVYASAMASFIVKKTVDIRKYNFEYVTLDPISSYCSPLIDHCVRRIVSPNDFARRLRGYTAQGDKVQAKAVYWFDYRRDYIDKSKGCQNYLFADYVKWDWEQMCSSKKYQSIILPTKQLDNRFNNCLMGSPYGAQACYPGSFRTLKPTRCDLINPEQIKVTISMCGIKNPSNRLAILKNIVKTLEERTDVFITLLMDGKSYREEAQFVEKMGLECSDKCLVINCFSDFEYLNIVEQHDLFIDLNPMNHVGYFLSAALHQGLLVAGFDQPIYRDILDNGKFGVLFKGQMKEFGYGFDRVVPNWDRLFNLVNKKLFNRRNLVTFMERRNNVPYFQATLEQRLDTFMRMWDYFCNLKMQCYSFVE